MHLDLLLNLNLKQQEWMPCTLTLPFMLLHKLLLKYCKCIRWRWKIFNVCVLCFVVFCFSSFVHHVSCVLLFSFSFFFSKSLKCDLQLHVSFMCFILATTCACWFAISNHHSFKILFAFFTLWPQFLTTTSSWLSILSF